MRLTHRHVTGNRFMVDLCDYDYAGVRFAEGAEKVMIEALDYKTNATWADVLLLSGEDNFPLLTEDFYGRGRLLILNVPENFADLYRLPGEIVGILNGQVNTGRPFYLAADPKWSLISYDNDMCCLHSFRPMMSRAHIVVRGACSGIQDLETGRIYADSLPLPAPQHRQDGARTRTAEPEYAFEIPVGPGRSTYLKILR